MANNMIWYEWVDDGNNFNGAEYSHTDQDQQDYYKILEVDYDATEAAIRSNYIRLALKWHPDKQKGLECATSRFQEINDAHQVLSDPVKRRE
ncbi:dnaJ-related protein SCJ1-like [Mangifera indica]|uniref:dnaJ-related protein SCJ1-like n=1 Tax=Mangifera indica TaxID=29780 RepID=UPI001CFAE2DE|nr:dnaJ-related protein SCJ1-like [Mangifera indica]